MNEFKVREGTSKDIPQLHLLGAELVSGVLGLRPDRERLYRLLMTSTTSKAHKLLVAVADGEIVGGMLTVSDSYLYAEKMYAHIVGLYSTMPGAGSTLVKETMAWVETRKAIQMVSYTSPVKTDVDELLLKNNFKDTGSMLLWRRYGLAK